LYFPATIGAVVVIYNLPDVPAATKIRFNGTVLADVFRGAIKKWNDPAIAALNPGTDLPDREIAVSYREDGSGTTYTFTDYLSKVSADWAKKPGVGMLVEWPVGLPANGNDGVAEAVRGLPGAIGYVELTYAVSKAIPFASIQNRAGNYVVATPETISSAANGMIDNMPSDLKQSITDAPGQSAYPIASYSYLLFFKRQSDRTKVEAFSKFVNWVLHDGQTYAQQLNYASLPPRLAELGDAQLKQIETAGGTSAAQTCKATLHVAPHESGPPIIRDEENAGRLGSD
jgi:phosphate transport system substrate-binding protein